VKLNIFTLTGQEKPKDITMSYNAEFLLHVSLEPSYSMATHPRSNLDPAPVLLAGVPIGAACYLYNPAPAAYFIFGDLSVRHAGWFRVKFTLLERTKDFGDSRMRNCMEVVSDHFQVFSRKEFPGMLESTHLTKALADQGCWVPVSRVRWTDTGEMKVIGGPDTKPFLDDNTYANFKSDSGYGSRPGTSVDGSILNSSAYQPTRQGSIESERQIPPPYALREVRDTREFSQEESESNHSQFSNKPFKRESSTLDPEKAAASPRMLEKKTRTRESWNVDLVRRRALNYVFDGFRRIGRGLGG